MLMLIAGLLLKFQLPKIKELGRGRNQLNDEILSFY